MGVVHQQNWLRNREACNSEDLFLTNCLTTRAVGLWAASLMGLDDDKATTYAQTLVIDFVRPGPLDIVQKLRADFQAKGIEVSEHRINAVIERQRDSARRQISLRIWSKTPGDGGWERRTYPRRVMIPPMTVPPGLKRWLERHMAPEAGILPSVGGMVRTAVANLKRMVTPVRR